MNDFEVGIVGAGPSGLSLARQLKTAASVFRSTKNTLWLVDFGISTIPSSLILLTSVLSLLIRRKRA